MVDWAVYIWTVCANDITVHNEQTCILTPYTTDLSHTLNFKYLRTGQLLKLLL